MEKAETSNYEANALMNISDRFSAKISHRLYLLPLNRCEV